MRDGSQEIRSPFGRFVESVKMQHGGASGHVYSLKR
jgi:hypothetical protein